MRHFLIFLLSFSAARIKRVTSAVNNEKWSISYLMKEAACQSWFVHTCAKYLQQRDDACVVESKGHTAVRNNKDKLRRNECECRVRAGQWIISYLCTDRASRELYCLLVPRISPDLCNSDAARRRAFLSEFMLGLNFKRANSVPLDSTLSQLGSSP